MTDERRPRGERRVGDATQARIDQMAKGWKPKPEDDEGPATSPSKSPSTPPPLPPEARRKMGKTDPLPGPTQSVAGAGLDGLSLEAAASPPPPLPAPGRAHARTIPRTPTGAIPTSRLAASVQVPVPRSEGSPPPEPMPAEVPRTVPDGDATLVPSGEDSLGLATAEFRAPATLPRRRGALGDMIYVWTVLLGKRRARLELRDTELEIEAEKRSRDKELTELARLAVSDGDAATTRIEEARDALIELEEARSRKAGAAAATEQAIDAILRERDEVKEDRERTITALEAEVATLEERLAPLEARRLEIGKRAREVLDQVERFDSKIRDEEGALQSSDGDIAVTAEASLAGLRAERALAAKRQPALAVELQGVEPEIRELKAKKGELAKEIGRLRRAEDESVVRSDEKVTAARAHKLVVDRAAADRTRDQNELLRDLGEALYREPPPELAHLAAPLEGRFAKLERLKARAVTAREKIDTIERAPLFRGLALWLLAVLAVGGIVFLVRAVFN